MVQTIVNTQRYETSSDHGVVGESGNVFIGGAMNILYSSVTEVLYDHDSCKFYTNLDYIMAPDSFATTYRYSEGFIRTQHIPTLKVMRDNSNTKPEEAADFNNQIKVWGQTLEMNGNFKKRATFDKNISFDGTTGAEEASTTSRFTET